MNLDELRSVQSAERESDAEERLARAVGGLDPLER